MSVRINKFPFFLWVTEKKGDLKVDLKNLKVTSEVMGNSNLKPVPIYIIVLMKYLPLTLLFINFYLPQNKQEVIIFFLILLIAVFFAFMMEFVTALKIIIIIFCVVNFYFVFNYENYAVITDTAITFFVEITLILAILFDVFYLKGYKNWYYLESFSNEISIKFAQKKEKPLVKFLKWGFFKKETGFNVTKKIALTGFFVRISNENN